MAEREVEDHEMFQNTCQHFNTWLRVAREKLATCSDTYGDKITVQSKMDKAKVCWKGVMKVLNLKTSLKHYSQRVFRLFVMELLPIFLHDCPYSLMMIEPESILDLTVLLVIVQ